jgi:HEAT repeat protein
VPFTHYSGWWGLYAEFATYTQKNENGVKLSEAPIFASVVHYYMALRGFNTQKIADVLGWPRESAKEILHSLEEPHHVQHCIDVSCLLGIPYRLRESALQRAGGYQLDESALSDLDYTQRRIYPKQGYRLTPVQTAMLLLSLDKHHEYHARHESLDFYMFRTYETALEVTRSLMRLDDREISRCQREGRPLPTFDLRPGFECLEQWLNHIEWEIQHSIWERRDQLLFIVYHFYQMGAVLWNAKAFPPAPPLIEGPLALHYKTKAFQAAKQLDNIAFMIKTLLERAGIYHAQDCPQEALQDVKDAVRYMALERKTLQRISSNFVEDDTELIKKLVQRSDGTLRDAFNKLYAKAISICKKRRTGYVDDILGPYEDLEAEDLAAARGGDFAFDDWDEEGEVDPVFASRELKFEPTLGFTTGDKDLDEWLVQHQKKLCQEKERQKSNLKKQLMESDAYLFPLGVWSDNLLQRLVENYEYNDERFDIHDRVRMALGKGKEQHDVAISLLVAGLKHKKHEVRAKSVLMLSELDRSRAVDWLIAALDDEDGLVPWRAASALGKLRDKRAVRPLITLLTSENSKVRLKAALLLDQKASRELHFDHFKVQHWANESKVLICVAEALGELKDRQAVKPLIALLLDKEYRAHKQAYVAEMYKGGEARDPSLPLLIEHEKALRCQIIEALEKLEDARAVKPLSKMLLEEDEIANKAARALGRISSPQVLPVLISALSRESSIYYTLLDVIVDSINKSDEQQRQEGIGLLLAALSSPQEATRLGAIRMLGRLEVVSAVTPLIALLQDPNSNVRSHVISTLACIPDTRCVEALIAHLNVEDKWERRQAANDLKYLGDASAVEPLIACLAIEDDLLRAAAVQSLGSLRDQRATLPLKKLLEHDLPKKTLRYILHALCQLRAEGVHELLLPILENADDKDDLSWVVDAVSELGDPRAINLLLSLVHATKKQDIRDNAIRVIHMIGGKQAVEALIQIVQELQESQREKFPNLSYTDRDSFLERCISCLKEMEDSGAIETLFVFMSNKYRTFHKQIYKKAAEVLAIFRDPRCVEPFIDILQDEVLLREEVRYHSPNPVNWELLAPLITALGELGDPAALPILREVARFNEENFFDLILPSRVAYRNYNIGERTQAAIERLTRKLVVIEAMPQLRLPQGSQEV